MKTLLPCLTLTALFLAGCEEVPTISQYDDEPQVLRLQQANDEAELAQFIRTGLLNYYGVKLKNEVQWEIGVLEDSTEVTSSTNESSASETNLIDQNVDESDWLKYQASNQALFMTVQPRWYYGWYDVSDESKNQNTGGRLEVFTLDDLGQHQYQSQYSFKTNANWIDGLYSVSDTQLVALYAQSEPYWEWSSTQFWRSGTVGVESINTRVLTSLSNEWDIALDGYLVDSRRIEDELYLITRYSPALPKVVYDPYDEGVIKDNIEHINDASLTDFLPHIEINGTRSPLMPDGRCYLPTGDEWINNGYPTFISITRVNLTDPTDWQTTCALAPIWQIAMNESSLYLIRGYHWEDQRTELHRFSIEGGLAYTDSVIVPGSMGWVSDQFRIKEQTLADQRVLTTITSDRIENGDWNHRLFNYAITESGKISALGELPNESYPERIGKPGENIRGARIDGDTAFVVTFEQIDPLYKLDISEPALPKMLGQLEIPGFSDYLHPVNDELLIGVGYQNDEVTNRQRVKVSLYDVAGDEPAVISEQLIGEGADYVYTPVTYDHHAFKSREYENGQLRFTIPVQTSSWENGTYERNHQLQLFDVDLNSLLTNDISNAPSLNSAANDNYYWGAQQRSVILSDSIHFAVENTLISAPWSSPAQQQITVLDN